MAKIRETLERYRVRFDHWFLEASLYEGDPERLGRRAREAHRRRPRVPERGRAVAAHDHAGRRREGPPARPLHRRADLPRRRRRLPLGQAPARLRHADQRARLRPPRLRGAAEGDHGRRGRRPRPPRGAAAAVRPRRRGRRARVDVQAPRRLRHARGADRRDRRRRDALLHALALGRLDRRPRPHARQGAVAENPVYYVQYAHARIASVLRKAGEERVAAALAAPRTGLALEPAERELVKKLLALPGGSPRRPSAARRTCRHVRARDRAGVHRVLPRLPRPQAPSREELESFRLATSVATQRVIARSLGLLGVSAPETM